MRRHRGCMQDENFLGPEDICAAIAAGAMDYVMPDPLFIWGVRGWLEAESRARAAGIEMSSHLFVAASSHSLCATPTGHWLEYMDVAAGLRTEPDPLAHGALPA
jgi:mandelate racemase